jgi:class 3 adenylate cyclase/predicted ATPase
MTVHCPQCAAELPDGMRFCGQCGAPLDHERPRGRERRLVSVLFCDLVGFTAFSEARDHEDVRDVLEHYFSAARRIVAAYDGTIEKFIGDAVMAVWGAPVAREDDAQRAVRAALDMTAAVAALADRLAIEELRVRVGVLTGEAAVDLDGVDQGMVIGDAVNTASRIQSLAAPGTVLVDEMTRLASERAIDFEAIGSRSVKGRESPVRVWRAVRVLPLQARPDGAVEPPFVGRRTALELIKDRLASVLAPEAGPRLVTVIGDAGLGKSRLGTEFRKHAEGISARVSWHLGRSPSFGEGTGLGALAEMVRMRAGIAQEDSVECQRALVQQLLTERVDGSPEEIQRIRRALHRLLDLDDGREVIEQGELFTAWRSLFERIAARAPAVMVFEELQAADQALLDFIAHVLEWATAPIMILALSRPDDRLVSLSDAGDEIRLPALSASEMDELVRGAVREAPAELLEAVRSDGGGIPLYAVETLRALADRGVLRVDDGRYAMAGGVQEMAVPPTVHALVASRLDGVGQLDRGVLAAGAVLGERFTVEGVAALSDVEAVDARSLLDGLVVKALLRRDDDPRSPLRGHYGFLQGVVRRVALGTLSRRDRKRLHLAAVEHLAHEPESPELASSLAAHLVAAEQAAPTAPDADSIRARAAATLGDAAERAAAVGALGEALSLFDQAAALIADEADRATVLEQAGAVAHRAGEAEAAAERYRSAGELHDTAGRERRALGARAHQLRSLRYLRSPAELLGELREVDERLADQPDAASALAGSALAFTLYQCGQSGEALTVAQRAVQTAERSAALGELIQALAAQASALAELERPQEAIDVYRRALELAVDRDARRVGPLGGNLAVSLASVGRYAEAAAQAREAVAAAQRTAERFFERWAHLVLGRALCSLGDWATASAEIEAVRGQVPPFQVGMAIAPLAVIALARGDHPRARALVDEHDRRCNAAGTSVFESDFRALRSAILAVDPAASESGAPELASVIPDTQVDDYTEWSGWLAPVIDMLVARPQTEPLDSALRTLVGDAVMKRTDPVRAQAERLTAHLAARAGDDARARAGWERAHRLADGCGLAFDSAVIALELAEHGGGRVSDALSSARDTFRRLGARPWLVRADNVRAGQSPG